MKKKKEPYLDLYPELTLEEFRQLCYIAYFGEVNNYNRTTEYYCKKFKISIQEFRATAQKLTSFGVLELTSFVHPRHHLKILMCLSKHYPSWAKAFNTLSFRNTNTAEYLWNLVQKLVKDDFEGAAKLTRPYIGIGDKQFNLFRYIQERAVSNARYMRLLNGDELQQMVDETLHELFANDELGDDYLGPLSEVIPADNAHHDEIMDEIAAFRYFLYGTASKPTGKPTIWSMAVKAMGLMYQGKLDDAFTQFTKAVKVVKNQKGAFASPMFNYAFGILLYRLKNKYKDSETYQQWFDKFRQSSRIRFSSENTGLNILLTYIDNDIETVRSSILRQMNHLTDFHKDTLSRTWRYLVFNFFGLETGVLNRPLHSAKLLQHELSAYLPIGPVAKQQLEELYGGQPLLSTIRRKAPWEVLLSDIGDQMNQHQLGQAKRVVYYVDGKDLQAVVEQVQRADGTWREGQLLSLSQMADTGYDCMDSLDVAIAIRLEKGSPAQKAIDVLVPQLVGTDRLMHGHHFDGKGVPVTINEEKPYLEFRGAGAFIEIRSNVALDATGKVPHHSVRYESEGCYSLITTNALQRDVMKRFLQMKRFPSSALMSLRRTIESLHGMIEVRENLLDALEEPAVESSGTLAVRIVPNKMDYSVSIMATAMPDGTARFIPAEGDETVYDEVEGLTHCVRRNLNLELSNYKQLADFLETNAKAESINYTDFKVWSSEGLLLLLAFVFDHQDQFFVEWPEGKVLKFKGDVKASSINIWVNSDEEWFTVVGEVKMAGKTYSLQELIAMCSTSDIKGFVKLNDEEYVRMSETLKKHIAAMNALPSKGGKARSVSKYQVGALANMIEGLNAHTDGGYAEFKEKTKAAYALNPEIPQGMTATLRDYQKEGFRWMCRLDAWGAGACLADDMGLGKTLQALTFLTYKADKGPSLVVMPKSVILNWASEAERFAPKLNIIVLNKVAKRQSVIHNAKENDVLLCTYGLLTTEYSALTRKEWNVICLDEAHQIKNRQTIASQTAMELKAKSRIMLTGTPLQNNLAELWNLFQFLNPGLLGPWARFRDNFIIPPLDKRHLMLLKDLTTPFILRRTKKEVLTELPEKIVDKYLVELNDEERKVYEEMRRLAEVKFKRHKSKKEREEAKTLDINFFAELMKLREAACDMRLVHEKWAEPSSKTVTLMELLESITENPENNVLIFSQFTSYLEMIKPELKKRKWDFLYLDGQTPMEKRQDMVDQFQKGQCRLFLSSLKAGGLGINLTAANYVILLDPWWNPAIENQAMDRTHRLGQKRVVTVIRLVSSQTIEEKILTLHEKKQDLSDNILDGTGESYKLSYEDILDMVAPF